MEPRISQKVHGEMFRARSPRWCTISLQETLQSIIYSTSTKATIRDFGSDVSRGGLNIKFVKGNRLGGWNRVGLWKLSACLEYSMLMKVCILDIDHRMIWVGEKIFAYYDSLMTSVFQLKYYTNFEYSRVQYCTVQFSLVRDMQSL